MDPFSITVGVVGLMATGSKVMDILKTLSDSSKGINERVRALIGEVETFNRVLGSTKATLESRELRPLFHSTGHLADHWRNIAACIRDGEKSMADFASALEKVDKSVRFMDSARKALRLKAALDDVAAFQRRLSSCRDTFQLSLQAALLWNQALNRDVANSQVELPGLAELTESINRLARDVSARITSLEQKVDANDAEEEMAGLSNLRSCVQSAAYVTSSATSLSLTADLYEGESIGGASGLQGIFPHRPSPHTFAWITNLPSASFANRWPGQDFSLPDSEWIPPAPLAAGDEADSDDEIEMDIVRVQLEEDREQLEVEDHAAAEQLLQKALTRLRGYRLVHKHSSMLAAGLLDLAVLYDGQGKWLEAKEAMTERLALLSRAAKSDLNDILEGKLALSWYLFKLGDAVQARIHAKECVKGYRKLGYQGEGRLSDSLQMMMRICEYQKDYEGAEEHRLLYLSVPTIASAAHKAKGSNKFK